MLKKIIGFFDHLEDWIRAHLSRYPLVYALIGGVGVVLFWRGVWHTADLFHFMTGPVSVALGVIILGLTGVLVSEFIGNHVILAGLKGEKKFEEKTREEIIKEEGKVEHLEQTLDKIEEEISEIREEISHKQL